MKPKPQPIQPDQPNKSKVDKKLQQFLDEVNILNKKYQYEIAAQLVYTDAGIVPRVVVKNVVPPIKTKKDIKSSSVL